MDTLTVPKIKDLVNKPTQQYKDIYETLQTKHTLPEPSVTDELSSFLSDLKKTTLPTKNMPTNTMQAMNMQAMNMQAMNMPTNTMQAMNMQANTIPTNVSFGSSNDIGYSPY